MTVNDLTDELTWDDDQGNTWTVNGSTVDLIVWGDLDGRIRVKQL